MYLRFEFNRVERTLDSESLNNVNSCAKFVILLTVKLGNAILNVKHMSAFLIYYYYSTPMHTTDSTIIDTNSQILRAVSSTKGVNRPASSHFPFTLLPLHARRPKSKCQHSCKHKVQLNEFMVWLHFFYPYKIKNYVAVK